MSSSFNHLTTGQIESQSLWLPTEVWVDVFKFLSRRDLLRHVQPICRRFHAIAEHKVDNVHVIRHFKRFLDRLGNNSRKAKTQYEELAGNDASLAGHFQLAEHITFYMEGQVKHNPLRLHAQMCVLRHSLDLFRGCQFQLVLNNPSASRKCVSDQMLAYLTLINSARPFCIELFHATACTLTAALHPDDMLSEPIILNCPRLTVDQVQNTTSMDSICNWLHHLPVEEDEKNQANETRILNLEVTMQSVTCAEIIECCKKLLQQSQSSPADRRTYLLIFHSNALQVPFHLEHPPTGEVLYLELFRRNHYATAENMFYHLRRCPIADLATTDQFYYDTFKDRKNFRFRTPVKNGLKAPLLVLFNEE